MKRTLVAAMLGFAAVGAAYGDGHILISNYINPPYTNQVYWGNGPKANQAVTAADGLTFQIYFGEGVISDPRQLTPGDTFQISGFYDILDPDILGYVPKSGHGPGGYFVDVDQNTAELG